MKTLIVVVDDQEVDRYLAKRCLTKSGGFSDLIESASGNQFLEQFFPRENGTPSGIESLLVIMDINMPGLDGFQTIEEVQQRMSDGIGPTRVIIVMFTSSNSQQDRDRAKMLEVVKGYISKPMDEASISQMRDLYESLAA